MVPPMPSSQYGQTATHRFRIEGDKVQLGQKGMNSSQKLTLKRFVREQEMSNVHLQGHVGSFGCYQEPKGTVLDYYRQRRAASA